LSDLVLDFDIEAIGFEPPEIDLRIQSLDSALEDADDRFEVATGPVVSRTGDLWLLGSHRPYCGNAASGEMSKAEFTDFLRQTFLRIIAYCRDGALTELAPRELPRVKGRCIGGASGDIN